MVYTYCAMKEKNEERLLKVAGMSRLKDTHMTELKRKRRVIINKACK